MAKREIFLKLTDEQQKTIKDLTGATCEHWKVNNKTGPLVVYGVTFKAQSAGMDFIKLTAAQKRAIKSVFGVSCEVIEITKDTVEKFHKC